MGLILYGYRYSVYLRIARLILAEKAVAHDHIEVNPFASDVPATYLAMNPFGRVPTLEHDGFVLYETVAITRYLDRAFPGPSLQPRNVKSLARMDQIIAVADAYAYWPLVRQAFSHAVFRPRMGTPANRVEIVLGLAEAPKVLRALDALVSGDTFIVGPSVSLADLHLGAMIAYFSQVPEGAALLKEQPRLSSWWQHLSTQTSFAETDPFRLDQAMPDTGADRT